MLDGVVLPPVTSDDPAQIAPGLGSAFVFGNEVNPQGSDRGFTGTLHEVRLAAATSVFHAGDFELQPKAVVAVGGNDVRWIGTEDGTARQNEWNVVPASVPADGGKISAVPGETDANRGDRTSMIQSVQSGAANSLHWWPAEADMKPTQGWFAHPNDVPKSPAALQGFPAERQKALAQGSTAEIDLGSPQAVDRIALSEHVGNIGVLRIHKFASTVTAQEFRITVTATRAPAFLSNISPYGTLAAVPEPAGDLPLDCSAPVAGTGTQDRPFNPLEQFRQAEISAGATIHVKAGTSCAASDTPFWGHGTTDAPRAGWLRTVVDRAKLHGQPPVDLGLKDGKYSVGDTVTVQGAPAGQWGYVYLNQHGQRFGRFLADTGGTVTVTVPEGTGNGLDTLVLLDKDGRRVSLGAFHVTP